MPPFNFLFKHHKSAKLPWHHKIFLSVCLFVLTSLWPNVWRVSSIQSHSLCPNSKVAPSHWRTRVDFELPGQLKKHLLFHQIEKTHINSCAFHIQILHHCSGKYIIQKSYKGKYWFSEQTYEWVGNGMEYFSWNMHLYLRPRGKYIIQKSYKGKCWLSEQAYEWVGQTQFLDSYLSVYVYVYVYQWYTISWYKTYKGKCWLSEQVYEWVGRTQWDFLQSWGMTADRIKEWPRNERKVEEKWRKLRKVKENM